MWEYNKKDGHVSASSAYDCIGGLLQACRGEENSFIAVA